MSLFHAEVTRSGAGWLIHVTELEESINARDRGEIAARAYDLIASRTELSYDQIDLVVRTERDSVRERATKLGFGTISESGSRIDIHQLPRKARSVVVRYDDYGAVVGIEASTQVAEFQTTRDGAFDALFYTAQYSDIRRQRLRREDRPEGP